MRLGDVASNATSKGYYKSSKWLTSNVLATTGSADAAVGRMAHRVKRVGLGDAHGGCAVAASSRRVDHLVAARGFNPGPARKQGQIQASKQRAQENMERTERQHAGLERKQLRYSHR